jgi:hypothetical protein
MTTLVPSLTVAFQRPLASETATPSGSPATVITCMRASATGREAASRTTPRKISCAYAI